MRARDRLEEAEFFLERLEETEGKGREFRFYLSACVSASRSITLVLQADLRSEHGAKFNTWWDERKDAMPTLPVPFETIRNLRNTLQKKGHILPAVFKMENETGVVEGAEVRYDPYTKDVSLTYTHPADKHTPTIERQEGETDNEFTDRLIADALEQVLSDLFDAVEDHMDLELSGYLLDEGCLPLPFGSIVAGLSEYLSVTRSVVEEAEKEFLQTDT